MRRRMFSDEPRRESEVLNATRLAWPSCRVRAGGEGGVHTYTSDDVPPFSNGATGVSRARLEPQLTNAVLKSTTAPTLPRMPLLPEPPSCFSAADRAVMRSLSGVKTRVSLYPASRKRSSRRSYVLDVPRRWSGTLPSESG